METQEKKIPGAVRDKIIVREIKEDRSAGGILLPDSRVPTAAVGEVIALGDGMITTSGVVIPLAVKVGDRVVFHPDSAMPFHFKGEMFIVIQDGDVMSVLPPFDPADNPPPIPLIVAGGNDMDALDESAIAKLGSIRN